MTFLKRQENYIGHRLDEPMLEQLKVVDVNEFLPQIGKWTSIGGGILVGIFTAGVSLASVLNYNVTVKVPATIRPMGELRIVESAITGTVQKIVAKDNQIVTQGAAIAYVDDARLQNQKSQLQNSIRQSQLQIGQIDAQLGEINTQISAQNDLLNRTIIAAQAELRGTERNYQDQQIQAAAEMMQAQTALTLAKIQQDRLRNENLLAATISETEAALNLARAQRDRLQREKLLTLTVQEAEKALNIARIQRDRLQNDHLLKATVEEAKAALQMAKIQRDRLYPSVLVGAVSLNFFEEKVQAVKSAAARLAQAQENAKNLLEEKEQAVKSAETRLAQAQENAKNLLEEKEQAFILAQTNLAKAQTALNPSNAPVTVASQRIKQEQARGEATLAALKKERETLLQQRVELQKQLDRSRKELQQIEDDLSKTVIRAPATGILLQMQLRNPGQAVQPSEAIARIAPLDVPMQIKARVPAQDIDKVKAGQKVQMQVSACPYPDYGTLQGTVKIVAPDALPGVPNTVSLTAQPAPAYEVTIEPQTLSVGRGDRQCQLKPGMEGRADIISRQETVMQFILRKARLIADM